MRSRFALWVVALALLPLLSFASPARADDPPRPPDPDKRKTPDVHKLYVPFKDLQKIFEKEGEGVFLPYAEFMALWDRAYRLPDDPDRPPIPAAVRSATYVGVAEGDMIRFEAKLEVEVLAKGWQQLALDFAGIGVEQATIDGQPALLVPTKTGYSLLLKDPGRRTVDLVLRVGAPAVGDTHTAQFTLPPVPLAKLSLRVPGIDTVVDINPRLASTTSHTPDGGTELLAFLGPVSQIQLTWRRRPDEGPRVDPLVFAAERESVRVDRGVVRTEFAADFAILRAPMEKFALAVPKDAVVLYVEGEGIRSWERNAAGDRIDVVLHTPAKEKYSVRVGVERPLPPPPVEVPLPLVGIEGLERETGFLRLQAAEGVKIEPRLTPGLIQVDFQDLPKPLQGDPGGKVFSYRYPTRPGVVTVDVQTLSPRISAAMGNRVGVKAESLELNAVAALTVERAGIFGVSFSIPLGLEVTDVKVQGVEMDDFTVDPAAPGGPVLRVAFRDRLLGGAFVWVTGRMPIFVPEEEGKEAEIPVPLIVLSDADHVRGYVAVHVDNALDRREVGKSVGLTPMESSAPAPIEPANLVATDLPLVYRFEHREGAVSLTLGLKRKAPKVTAFVEQWIRLEPDRTRMATTIRYQIDFRGVDTLRFLGPLEDVGPGETRLDMSKRVHLTVQGMQLLDPEPEQKPEGAPDGWKPVHGIWKVKLAAARTGLVEVPLLIDDRPEVTLESGHSRKASIPSFVPLEAEGKPLPNTVYHVAVRRDPLLEVVAETTTKAEEIDARELPPSLQAPDNFLAYRSYDPEHDLVVGVTKHDYEPVAEVVVSHVHLNTVLPREKGKATTDALMLVRNNDRQYLELRMPAGAKIRTVTVNGKTEIPHAGEKGSDSVLIPIQTGLGKDQAFWVAVSYDHDVEWSGALFQSIRIESPVPVKVTGDILTWRVFVPDDLEYTSFDGTVDPEEPYRSWAMQLIDRLSSGLTRNPHAERIDASGAKDAAVPVPGSRVLRFSNRTGAGWVGITGIKPTMFTFWKILWLVIAFVGARFLVRFSRGFGVGAAVAFCLLLFPILALLIPAGAGMAAVLNVMLYGVLLSGAISFVGWWAAGRREAAARALAPPPAPTTPPPAPAPAGGGGA